jgi:FKBP-type peptidyl-prolyl cis-trans isomerase
MFMKFMNALSMNTVSCFYRRFARQHSAFIGSPIHFFAFLFVLATLASACLPTDPPLDMTGDLIIVDNRVGDGAAVSTDTSVITQVDVRWGERLPDGTLLRATSATKMLVGTYSIVEGLEIGLRGMRVGGSRTITIPPRLGYGNTRQGPVPPNSTVIADIELLGVEEFKIEDLVVGTGDTVRPTSFITVAYVGRLTNGNIFDATTVNSPFSFSLGTRSVIQGWEIGIPGMRVGGKRRLTIPSLLGYGAQRNGSIPPNSTLIFEVTLLSAS